MTWPGLLARRLIPPLPPATKSIISSRRKFAGATAITMAGVTAVTAAGVTVTGAGTAAIGTGAGIAGTTGNRDTACRGPGWHSGRWHFGPFGRAGSATGKP